MSEIIYKAQNIKKTYVEGKVKTQVLKGVNLEICKDEITAIIGQSGSGKSTLLHILGTLDTPDTGSLEFKGTELLKLSNQKKAQFRNLNLGFVYQFHHLLGDFTALENVMMPLLIANVPVKEAKLKAKEYLQKVGLSHRVNFRPNELSGGERQRVAIARAIVNKPDLILADEPTGNLDAQNAQEVFSIFSHLVKTEHVAVVMVTHDQNLASKCDKIYKMIDGEIDA
ncbi:MAG: lipoprotein-releasing ABC transporter ATP-binding protein LolD [Succinivibrio sp.]|jgi:lipoprotein-releasing system ATP-binding protein|nr:lipoprotein-releasing ABC transporter ATP-binding protein LolD [Succinivibrio sp.]MCI5576435.1 lipoprotein-releasing ABC transporter ATP-binding protein LolD [Succinivibrio sp.]MCI5637689.1 lipoprotein-releasing ABC transporter ATP-binding protein LolD [Succinivibrio sp.]MCI6448932.1 lipoprotein-releasing ABC transporter ATP-binding protein LolD [Succinivibrio sp.]MCI7773060.1 lipoprotein-releasing ABC transporter ATP-binding protein LolD [Succinivibrio sp.]